MVVARGEGTASMVADEQRGAWHDRRRAMDDVASTSAADTARPAAAFAETVAELAAQRGVGAELVPHRADELLQEARDARAR